MRWVRLNIEDEQYAAADAIIERVFTWQWLSPKTALERLPYMEAGWFALHRGEFNAAADHMASLLSRGHADDRALKWLIEASWLANTIGECADSIAGSL